MSSVYTKDVTVINSTTETEVFRTNLGVITETKIYRIKTFGVVNNNASLTNDIQFGLYLNNTLLTYGIGVPDTGSPFLCSVQDIVFRDAGNQVGTTIFLTGQSAGGNTDDGGSHLHLGETTLDTSDESNLVVKILLGAANANFGVTIKSVIVEEVL